MGIKCRNEAPIIEAVDRFFGSFLSKMHEKRGQFLHFPIENRRKRGGKPTCVARHHLSPSPQAGSHNTPSITSNVRFIACGAYKDRPAVVHDSIDPSELLDQLQHAPKQDRTPQRRLVGFSFIYYSNPRKKGQFLHFPIRNRRKRGENRPPATPATAQPQPAPHPDGSGLKLDPAPPRRCSSLGFAAGLCVRPPRPGYHRQSVKINSKITPKTADCLCTNLVLCEPAWALWQEEEPDKHHHGRDSR